MPPTELTVSDLYHVCDPEQFTFKTTDDMAQVTEIVGQARAVEAVRFGIDIDREGYNIFALGPPGTGKHTLIRQFLEHRAPEEPAPEDWCYVNNFDQPHKPVALSLPAGQGQAFRQEMEDLIDDARTALASAFESDAYHRDRQALEEEVGGQQESALDELREHARERGLEVVRTPGGIAFTPSSNGGPMPPEEIQNLPQAKRQELEKKAEELQDEVQDLVRQAPRVQRMAHKRLKELNRRTAAQAVEPLLAELRATYEEHAQVRAYLEAVEEDLVTNGEEMLKLHQAEQVQRDQEAEQTPVPAPVPHQVAESALLRRYRVNVLVEHDPEAGAPVVSEDHPTYMNIVGRVEHLPQMGALITDFNLIKAGALHRANGGYLIVDMHKLLMQPLVWEGLKRALRAQQVRIDSPGQEMGLLSTVTLEPEPIPLKVKVVLFGRPMFYGLLRAMDPEFEELFKVAADFETDMDRSGENQQLYAQLIATLARKEKMRPFEREAVARIIEHSSRMAGDARKLSVHMRRVADLLREADYWARHNGNGSIHAADVQKAIDAQIYRSDRIRERLQEQIERGTLLIDTQGERTGQINALAVFPFGDFFFGKPSRITVRVRMGKGEVVDIEREVELGDPVHSKGVLILAGFLNGRYASELPLSLSASVVFEQSYGGIGGDSASSAELYALLSAIADVPIKQSLAVTGSVNQHGQIQAIGGVNEKIEGFFDTCRRRELTGEQGVLIPAANVEHLMLRRDVIEAVEAGRFHIYAVATVDEGIEVLTGLPAGERDEQGRYPSDSVNGKVAARLRELAQQRQKFVAGAGGEEGR